MRHRPKPPAPPAPFGGVPARHSGETNHPPSRVVIHSAVVPCERGRARQLAEWNAKGSTGGSWHYATDPGATLQCSWDRFVCHHAPPNGHSLGIEMADIPGRPPTAKRGTRLWWNLRKVWRWRDAAHRATLQRTADLTGDLLLAYGLPAVWVTPAGLRKGRRGVTSHNNVSRAFGQSSHWDPGWWPRRRFMRLVRNRIQARTGK